MERESGGCDSSGEREGTRPPRDLCHLEGGVVRRGSMLDAAEPVAPSSLTWDCVGYTAQHQRNPVGIRVPSNRNLAGDVYFRQLLKGSHVAGRDVMGPMGESLES